MTAGPFLRDLLIAYTAGLAMVVGLARVRVPPVVALILTGLLAGPSGLGLIGDPEHIDVLAEVGVDLLLFTVGLDFSVTELRRIWRIVVAGGALQMAATSLLVAALVWSTNLASPAVAVFLGVFVAMSSTAVVLRGLGERNEIDAPHGRLSVGVLLFQDLAIVVALILVPVLAGRTVLEAVPALLGRAGLALAAVGVIGRLLLPPLLRLVIRARRPEVFPFALLVASVGTAWLCAQLGLPTAVGAFFGGLVLAESEFSHQAQAEIRPLRDLLASLFFISLGMIIDLGTLAALWLHLLLAVALLVCGKALVAAAIFFVLRQPPRVSVMAGVALAQIGEFSFIFGRAGLEDGLIDQAAWQFMLGASALSMLLTPLLLALAPSVGAWVAGRLRRHADVVVTHEPPWREHVVILGYGLGGQLIGAALRVAERRYFVVELNGGTVLRASAEGVPIIYGDATNPGSLGASGVATAAAVVIVLSDPEASRRAVRAVRAISADVPVIVRTRYRLEAERLRSLGATTVIVEELEASLEVLGQLLTRLGLAGNRVEAILETLRHEAVVRPLRAPTTPLAALPSLLQNASVATHELGVGDWAVGRTIAETALRSFTGTSIVALGRGEDYVASPPADVKLDPGDVLYLIGSREAVDRARRHLRGGE